MKRNDKSSTPIIASHAKKNNGHNGTTAKMKSLVLERISDGILAFDAGMNHVYVNERAGEILGREPQDLLGKNFWEEYPESTGSPFADACQRAFETQTVVPFDGYFPPSDTRFEGRVYPSSDGLSVLISNYTDPKQAGDLDVSQFPMQNPNPIMRFTRDGKLLYANPSSAALLASWKGQTEQVLPANVQELLSLVMETHSNQEIEIENGGKTFSCLLVPLPESGYVNLYFSDITERKQAQEAVDALIHQTTTGITRTDLQGRLLFVNQAYCEMLGYSEAELLGKATWEVNHPDDIAKNKRLFERMISDGEPYRMEKRIVRRNGSILWVSIGGSPLHDAAGQTYAAVTVIVDITRRKRAEESLLDSARRTLYLASLSDAIRSLPGTSQIEIEATRILGMHLKASRVAYATVKANGTATIRNNYVDGLADMTGEHNISEYIPDEALPKFRAGQAFVSSGASKRSKNGEPLAASHEAAATLTQVVIPLIRDGELVAALFVQQSQARNWKNEEIHLMEETAERMQTAMERARAEEALASERELLERILESMPVMLSMYDSATGSQRLNRQFKQLTGWDTTSARELVEACYPNAEYRQEVVQRMLKCEPNEWIDVQMQTRDGSTLDTTWSNIKFSNGIQVGLGIDITERKHVEEKYRRIVETANEGIWEIDKNTRTVFVNQRMAEMLGYTAEEMLGHSSFDFIFPEDYSDGEYRLARAKTGAAVRSHEFRYHRKDGSELWTFVSSTPKLDAQGNFAGAVAMMSDITERKHAEEEIQRLNAELQSQLDETKALLNILPTGVWIGNHDCSVITGNAAAYQMMGLSQGINASVTNDDPQIPSGMRIFVNGEEVAPEDAPMQAVARSGKPIYNIEHDLLFPNGNIASVYASIVPLFDEHGAVRKVIGAYTDFTERKHDEQTLIEFARQQTALYKLVDQLHRANTIEDVFNSSLDAITNSLQCDRSSILLFDETEIMHFVAWRGLSDEYRKATDGHSPWKYSEKDTLPIYFNDVESSDLSDSLKAVIKKEGIRSLAFIPLVYQENLIGKFMVYFNELHVFSNTELDLSLTIGRQLASGVDRKRAEEALRQSEERFARFMQYLPGLAWIKDVQGRYVYANAAAEKAFSTSQEQLYGRTDQEIFPAQVASQFKQNDKQALLEGRGVQVVETLEQDDGVIHHSLVTKFPIPGPDGKTTLIGGTAFDITDRIQMEDALRQARKHAEQTADRLARLQEVTASLAGSAIPMQLAERILEQGTRATGAATGILSEYDGQELKTIAALGYPEGTVRAGPLSLSEPTPMSDCIRTGRAVWIKTQAEFAARYPHLVELWRNMGHESMVALPLIVGERTLGGLAFSFAEAREFLLEERGFFLAVAQQCAQALERAHVEEARRESEERYRAIVNQATAGIVRKDADGKLLFVNDAFGQMLGYSNSELVNQTMWQLTHEDDVHENQRLFNRLMVEGIPFQLEKRLIRRDGSILWATVSVSPVLDSAGKPQSAVSVYADITERKHIEVALNESRERYRDLFNLVPVAVYTCNADGLIREYNRSAVELWGREPNIYDPDERYCGSSKLYHPDGRFMPHTNCPTARMLRGETLDPSELEIIVERPDGSRRNVVAHPLPLKNEGGEIVGAINCLYDMTERKQAEDRLTLLAEVSELTRNIEEPEELMSAVANVVGGHLQVKRCLFNEIDIENDREIVHHDYHPGTESVAGVHKITDYSSVTSLEMAEGKTIVNADSKTDPRTADDYERSYVPNGERAYVAVPLMREERWVASLWVSDDKPRQWSEGEVSLLQTVAERTWTATEKLRINAALRDSEERLRVTFNTTAVGVATLELDTQFVDVNDAFCRIVGYSREELLGTSCLALTHPDHIQAMKDNIARLVAGEVSSFVLEKLYIRKNGEEIWAQNSVSLLRDADENPLHLIAISQDISERKQREDALRARTEEIETLMAVSPIGILVAHDPECIHITGNPAAYTLLGFPVDSQENLSRSFLDEVTGKSHRVLRDGVELAIPDLPMQRSARLGIEVKEETLELRFEDGTSKYIYQYAKPLFDPQGRPRGTVAAVLDITDRKQTEDALQQLNLQLEVRVLRRTAELQAANEFLRESEATARLILESMPDAILIADKDGQIVYGNAQVESLFGYSPKEVIGQPVEMLIPERFHENHAVHRQAYNGQRQRRYMGLSGDMFGQRKDNSEFPVDVMLSPISNNTTWDVMVTIRDNTEQKQAQQALRTNEEKLRKLFEILPVGVSFLNHEGQIMEMNSALTHILGLSKRELLEGKFKPRQYIRSDGSPMSPSEFASVRAHTGQKTVYNVETGIIKENGETIWTSVNAAPVDIADVDIVVTTIDITERKKAEDALHKNRERLRILSRRLVEVQEEERRALARELHDRVGQNLAALNLNLNILRGQLSSEALQIIGSRLDDSVTLVNQILTITRSVMSDLRSNVLDDYGLESALREFADQFTVRTGVQVVTDKQVASLPRLDPSIEMTLLRIAQEALTNVARHAQAKQATVSVHVDANAVYMSIQDDGIGILSWQRANQPGSHGLQIIRERAEAFGGSLQLHSTYKKGTRIEVKIPLVNVSPYKVTREKRS